MNKIKTKVSKETNYVYHMLSVAKCGYDNEYGSQYQDIHSKEDLKILKSNESLITVSGGEHCGQLYGLLVSIPASLETSAQDYYSLVNDLFKNNDVESNVTKYMWLYRTFLSENKTELVKQVTDALNAYIEYKTIIEQISDVMIRNYSIYCNKVWDTSVQVLQAYANEIERIFNENGYTDDLEKLTGHTLKSCFYASFCNSLDGGAEAIDISETQDVFGIGREYEWAVKFILHEYVIYLLKNALKGTSAFTSLKYWKYIECLAEFYVSQLYGETGAFKKYQDIINFYKRTYDKNKNLTPKDLYQMALSEFNVNPAE